MSLHSYSTRILEGRCLSVTTDVVYIVVVLEFTNHTVVAIRMLALPRTVRGLD
ncbi:hypothetical protein K466DRAFT_587967 [Polyporus arcularius HHB13444]|uniref:Uncharacterized protein n=1 Tax=Polyporus arcularius HHB13444 TaxID=1314778 RepID=A0A5C3P7I2_9APHY|nr:hypothetical protein K466DRAFT_587967 [Polyporus arcularius HHB13444]